MRKVIASSLTVTLAASGLASLLVLAPAEAHHKPGHDKGPKPEPTPTETEPEPTPTEPEPTPSEEPPPPPTGGQFPIGVWLQDPAGNAADYKALGVTTFLGLWDWPSDDGKWPGWAQASLDALATHGMNTYAGESPEAIEATLAMENNYVVTGWLAGDEPDMFGPDPQTWQDRIAAMKAVQDRPVAANFGLGFGGFGWWYDHLSDAERAAWCEPIDVPSVDYYGMTNPEPEENKGAWTYGRAVNNLRKACGDDKPLGSFVEVTEIDEAATTQTPEGIRDAAWNAIVNGADAINWFIHDFKCNPECGPSVFLYEDKWAANRAAMAEVNAELHQWATVLAAPDATGATSTGIPLDMLVKRVDGVTYVFAQATGDQSAPQGYSGTATVTVDGRSFTDLWEPYQVRVYIAEG